jgi:hypothetical protein
VDIGAVIVVFGVLLIGRGAVDVYRNRQIADDNRHRNHRIRTGTLNQPVPFVELRDPRPEKPWAVGTQGHRVLAFGMVVMAAGLVVSRYS